MARRFSQKDDEFISIVESILQNEKFKEMDNELHHGITRYGHSLRVAKAAYKCTKLFKLNYKEATQAALLHDFYINSDLDENLNSKELLDQHPLIALNNAKIHFKLNEKQENIIASHMYPLGKTKPKYMESWVVSGADKVVAAWEMYRYKFSLIMNIWAIFLFNMITSK